MTDAEDYGENLDDDGGEEKKVLRREYHKSRELFVTIRLLHNPINKNKRNTSLMKCETVCGLS